MTVISEQEWKKIGRPPISPATRKLRCPDAHILQATGMFIASLESDSRKAEGEIYVVRGLTKPLLGLPAIEQLHLLSRIAGVSKYIDPKVQFPALFTGLGKLKQPYTI